MKRNRTIPCLLLILGMVLTALSLSGCGSNQSAAEKALAGYLENIQNKHHSEAYMLVSDFDKKHITEATFSEWRSSVDGLVEKKSFQISKRADRFRDYEYLGTRFKDAYGFEVVWDQERLVSGVDTTDYDEDTFLIMMVEESGSFKVFLMIPNLPDRTAQYLQQYKRGSE